MSVTIIAITLPQYCKAVFNPFEFETLQIRCLSAVSYIQAKNYVFLVLNISGSCSCYYHTVFLYSVSAIDLRTGSTYFHQLIHQIPPKFIVLPGYCNYLDHNLFFQSVIGIITLVFENRME